MLHRDLDAYFNWPGMFAMLGMVPGLPRTRRSCSGWPAGARPWPRSATSRPLLLIARSITPQRRLQWLGVGIFFLVNWSGQDYFAPQTLAFWLMLCILGVVMTVIRRKDDPARGPVRPRGSGCRSTTDGLHRMRPGDQGVRIRLSRAQWNTVHAVLLLAVAASIASHQLTPVIAAPGAVRALGRRAPPRTGSCGSAAA